MNHDDVYTFQLGTTIHHGFNSLSRLAAEVRRLGGGKVLVVSDKGVSGAGLTDRVTKHLTSEDISHVVFDDVEVDPCIATVERALAFLRKERCDVIAAVGGGSPVCAAKGIALLATNGGSLRDYEGMNRYGTSPLPVIAIPTTAGAGSEVSPVFIVTDEARNFKIDIGGPACFPRVAILDPLLLRDIPFWPAVNAGLDALTHAVEACCTGLATPLTDCIALEAIRMIVQNLAPAVLTNDLEAKNQQLLASTMANVACGNAKLGLVHALSKPLSAFHLPHGYANGILLPFVMEFNLPACAGKLARMARALGEGHREEGEQRLAELAVHRVKQLYASLGFPNKLDEEQVSPNAIPEMVESAMTQAMWRFNVRRSTKEDLAGIYARAFQGWEL